MSTPNTPRKATVSLHRVVHGQRIGREVEVSARNDLEAITEALRVANERREPDGSPSYEYDRIRWH